MAAHLRQLPRLHAEESLHTYTLIAAGNGLIKKEELQPIIAGWRSLLDGDRIDLDDRPRKRKTLDELIQPGLPLAAVRQGRCEMCEAERILTPTTVRGEQLQLCTTCRHAKNPRRKRRWWRKSE